MSHILDTIPDRSRGPGGAVAIIQDGALLAHRVWGFADSERRIPMTSRTQIPICSVSKQFLCLVIQDLDKHPTEHMKEHGGADVFDQLTDHLHKMLPHLVGRENGSLNVGHLWNMQSGLRDYWAETVLWGAKPDDAFSLAHDAPASLDRTKSFHFSPGTEFSYCNVNFHVLARLVESMSGQSWAQLLAERVFKPAGMENAALYPNTAGPPLPIVGYEGDELHGYRAASNRIEWSGDAGIVASLEDMIAYEAYLDRSWPDPESTYRAIAEQQIFNDGTYAMYGCGLGRTYVEGKLTLGHGGALRGFRIHRVHVPHARLSVVVMLNHEGHPANLAESILKQALNIPEPDKQTGVIMPVAEWKGNFFDEETKLLLKVDVNDKGELIIDMAGAPEKMEMTDPQHAESPTMTAGIDGDTVHVERTRDNRHYYGRRITKPRPTSTNGNANLISIDDGLAGSYHCSDIESTFHCSSAGSNLMYGWFEGFLGKGPVHIMRYVGQDIWLLACPRSMDAPPPGDWTCVFKRGDADKAEGVTIGCWLARKLEFTKTS